MMNTPKQNQMQGEQYSADKYDHAGCQRAIYGQQMDDGINIRNTFSTESSTSEDSANAESVNAKSPESVNSKEPDLETRTPLFAFQLPNPRKPRSTEKEVHFCHPVVFHSSGEGVDVWVDKNGSIEGLIEPLKKQSLLLKIGVYNTVTKVVASHSGQASIVQCPEDEQKQFFITAVQNIVSDHNDDGEMEICRQHWVQNPGFNGPCDLEFPNVGFILDPTCEVPLRDGYVWKSGIDICRGPAADIRSLIVGDVVALDFRQEVTPTVVVDANFEYEVGMKIAIAAYTDNRDNLGEIPKQMGVELSMAKDKVRGFFSSLLRPRGIFCPLMESKMPERASLELFITTGEVTHVGATHIEHNVCTNKGHSGALVVVNDPDHEYHGKAIAIHAGYKNGLGKNVGFKLQGMSFD